ncbi:MAG: extradiol dioxygenase [Actinobacteria bacterium]|nr:extradiol dioxygenase [Actinomycetota bacterium]
MSVITGAHVILYSKDPAADREFLAEVLGLPDIDVGDGWLIFGLPPAEVAVHPAQEQGLELYLMTDDVAAFIATATAAGTRCAPVADRGWGLLTTLTLPGGGDLGVYEPRHARPPAPGTD